MHGARPGKEIGHVLAAALQAVIDGNIPNDREILQKFTKDLMPVSNTPEEPWT